jgi:UDPglucose--hexose-1-phosphate uridylyltransferase
MHTLRLTKPDGRALILYGREPIEPDLTAPSPRNDAVMGSPHLRWHPLRGEWVVYAGSRQNRTFLPAAEHNPLAPTQADGEPTELPAGHYDVAVFENMFPAFTSRGHEPPASIVPTLPAHGVCEVVVFSQDPTTSLGALPLSQVRLIVDVWAQRYEELGARPDVKYVYVFENRGAEVGVTLHHPHGQIYAYPFVPPIPARELALSCEYLEQRGAGLLESIIQTELNEGTRIVAHHGECVALVPAFARYANEVWIAPQRAVPSLSALSDSGRTDFARVLKLILSKYDALWEVSFPYVMAIHQAPTDGAAHPEAHLHVELYPAYRMRGRLKYLAGSELGAGVFTADTLPEQSAAALRDAKVDVDA